MLSTSLYSLLIVYLLLNISACDDGDSEKLSVDEANGKRLKILMVSDSAFGHIAPLLSLGEELNQRGHNVTMLLILDETRLPKFKTHIEKYGIHLWNVSSEDMVIPDENKLLEDVKKSFIVTMVTVVRDLETQIVKILVKHIDKSLSAGDWDIVVGIDFLPRTLISCMRFSHNTPFVFVGTFPLISHLYPSWPWPGFMHGASSDNLGFFDRFKILPFHLALSVITYALYSPSMDAVTKYCPSVSLSQALTDIGVHIPYIIPTVIGFDYSRTISPMTEYVGPLISRSPAPLSGELGEWLRGKSDRSVVYISMGSLFALNKEHGRAFLEGVMKTNYSLLWSLRKANQWILDGLEVDPDRVLISDWTPQFSVLGSAAVHSAILHGGFNGLSEALWNGVPVIVFPQMDEQIYNAGRVHFNGLGIHLDSNTISSSNIAESLWALDAGEYRSKVSKLQKMFRIAGGAKRAADLVELYEEVGYAHLVPAYAKYQWNWVKYYNADVYALLTAILAFIVMCLVTCCKCICRRCLSKNKPKKKKVPTATLR